MTLSRQTFAKDAACSGELWRLAREKVDCDIHLCFMPNVCQSLVPRIRMAEAVLNQLGRFMAENQARGGGGETISVRRRFQCVGVGVLVVTLVIHLFSGVVAAIQHIFDSCNEGSVSLVSSSSAPIWPKRHE